MSIVPLRVFPTVKPPTSYPPGEYLLVCYGAVYRLIDPRPSTTTGDVVSDRWQVVWTERDRTFANDWPWNLDTGAFTGIPTRLPDAP